LILIASYFSPRAKTVPVFDGVPYPKTMDVHTVDFSCPRRHNSVRQFPAVNRGLQTDKKLETRLLSSHVGMVLITMRRYIECGDTSYDVSPPAGPPMYRRILNISIGCPSLSPAIRKH
jgi:hypothetical protein